MLHLLHQKDHLKIYQAHIYIYHTLYHWTNILRRKKKKKKYVFFSNPRLNSLLWYWLLTQENHELRLSSENTDIPFMSSIPSTFHTKIAWWETRLKNMSKLISTQISRKAWASKCLSRTNTQFLLCLGDDGAETTADTKICLLSQVTTQEC